MLSNGGRMGIKLHVPSKEALPWLQNTHTIVQNSALVLYSSMYD